MFENGIVFIKNNDQSLRKKAIIGKFSNSNNLNLLLDPSKFLKFRTFCNIST